VLLSKKRHPRQVNQANQEPLEVRAGLAQQDITVRREKKPAASTLQSVESQVVQEKRVEMVEKEVREVLESMAEMELTFRSLQINTSLAPLLKFGPLVQMVVREDQAVPADLVEKEVRVVKEEEVEKEDVVILERVEVMEVMEVMAKMAVMAVTEVHEVMEEMAVMSRYNLLTLLTFPNR